MPDGQLIACPTCAKKFKLPERPPATFTCTGCQTVMDLSAFRAAAAEAPAAAAAAEPSAPAGSRRGGGGAAAASGRRAGAPRSGRAAGAAAARLRARRGEEEGDEEGRRGAPPPKKNTALIWGSLVGLVAVVGIAFLALGNKGGDEKDADKGKPTETAGGAPLAPVGAPIGPATPEPAAPPPGGEPAMDAAPSAPYVPLSRVEIHAIDHHPEATEDEKRKIDDLINLAIFQNAGADSKNAGTELVGIGVKAAPRLVNVFHTVKTSEGFGNREGNSKAQIADALLRRIDGHIERRGSPRLTPIRFSSDEKHAISIAKRWVAWWDNKLYLDPRKPWDERVDGNREDAPDKPADDAAMKGSEPPVGR
jgi:hypothetical protein